MSDCPVVSTPLGKVSGFALAKAKCPDAQQVYGYLGIPFAKPPVGDLRFKPPQSAEPWKGTRDGTKYPPGPMQSTRYVEIFAKYVANYRVADENPRNFEEDCLYLNVFTPKPSNETKLPVLIWFYGGGFSAGSSVGYHGQTICGLQDVVLVVPQYRLNAFGFISFGKESSCPGNMGLLDQKMAMEWTRDNILAFGGDPNNVTLFGRGAGGISVSSHVLSPMSRGLFHRAISCSGVANCQLVTKENNDVSTGFLLKELGIEDKDPEVILAKLRTLSAKELMEAQEKSADYHENPLQKLDDFVSVVDGKFLPKHPRDLVTDGYFAPVPFIIGCNNTEFCGVLADRFPEGFVTGELSEQQAMELTRNAWQVADNIPPNKLDEGVALVKQEMMKYISPDDKYKWSKLPTNVMLDTIFLLPGVEQAMAHSDAGNPTYMYTLNQQLRIHHDNAFSKDMTKKPEFCEADHIVDEVFTFGVPFGNGPVAKEMKFTEDEKNLSKQWMSFICNFAKTGNPNKPLSLTNWPSFKSNDQRHLVVKIRLEQGVDLMGERFKFWQNLRAKMATTS